ncbi:MAG: carboxypeptidase regulatory-like domain-containing protein [Verrucomicrobiota bacterium]
MKLNSRLFAVAALLSSLQLMSAADITGKITLKGTPPPEKELPLDPQCGKLHTTKPKTRFYVVGAAGELADVFVYIKEGLTAKPSEPPGQPVLLDQVGCEYTPYVLGLQTKQKLLVRNSDPVLHNVHPTPTVAGNKESNMAQLPKSKDLEFVFNNPEIFLRFKCDVHPWMFSYAGVLDHPYYAVSGKDGAFKIANAPPGEYVVEAYHRKAGKSTQKVTVAAESKQVDFGFEIKAE